MDNQYNHKDSEKSWIEFWKQNKTFKVFEDEDLPKYYILDMFPYPSGDGLHLGHVLCNTATDVLTRFKKLQGFNVLHPMGFDAFGLPAEQYAIETGRHPQSTTFDNINNFRNQLIGMGFAYDWDREVTTSEPEYYKWTQWIFCQLFNSWYNPVTDKAEPIDSLIEKLRHKEIENINWDELSEQQKDQILHKYRLAYLSETYVNWCPGLGTVLANDEVINGVSERGGYPVERRRMKQWSLRITAYAARLLDGLDQIKWNDSIKEAQRNWIGRSKGAVISFGLSSKPESQFTVYTTRPDTIYGCTFIALAPEHELIPELTDPGFKEEVQNYLDEVKSRSERDRISETVKMTGQFTGTYATHPLTKELIPIWISDYIIYGYGTGIIMGVPAHDTRDYNFAKTFNLPVIKVIDNGREEHEGAYDAKEGILINSPLINGLNVKEAQEEIIKQFEQMGIGKAHTSYRLRDAAFGRQRYWGEPIPIFYKDGIPHSLPESELPLVLPEIDKFLPTESGEPPLARAKDWYYTDKQGTRYPYEYTTMPGWAGSNWYYLRYMDPHNEGELVAKDKLHYWKNIDVYLGGAEHTTGHLLYFRFITKFLHDLDILPFDEPARKLINQGMILGKSSIAYRINGTNTFVSAGLKAAHEVTPIRIDITLVRNNKLDVDAFRRWRKDYAGAEFILENGEFICDAEVEKMSKRKHNVVTPESVIERYGADALRSYLMFLGPLEQSKPWDIRGIEGISRFLKRTWSLFYNQDGNALWNNAEPSKEELKAINHAKKRLYEDIERYSFNTPVSTLMILVNELGDLKCTNIEVLKELLIILSPYAPFMTEELWSRTGQAGSIALQRLPAVDESYLVKETFDYPISINGKLRTYVTIAANEPDEKVIEQTLANEVVLKWIDGKPVKKVIHVKGKIINVVI